MLRARASPDVKVKMALQTVDLGQKDHIGELISNKNDTGFLVEIRS